MFLGLCECAIHPASVKLSLIPYFIMALLLFPTFSPQVILSSPLFSIIVVCMLWYHIIHLTPLTFVVPSFYYLTNLVSVSYAPASLMPRLMVGSTILAKLELWESVMVIIIFGLPLTYAYATLRQSVAGNSPFRGIVFCNLSTSNQLY